MAKERLSKLQKWVLKEMLTIVYTDSAGVQKTGLIKRGDIFRFFKNTFTFGNMEIPIEKNFKAFLGQEYNKINATISRSIRGLRNKGYVELIGHEKIEIPNFEATESKAFKEMMSFESPEKYAEAMLNSKKDFNLNSLPKMLIERDVERKIEKGSKNNVKILKLTTKGADKSKELLKLSSNR